MKRREFSKGLLAAGAAAQALGFSSAALAQRAAPVEGQQYKRLAAPLPTQAGPGKIEVLEFFSYECPFCNAFEPALEAWAKEQPADVVLRRVPVYFLPNAQNYQRIYFALEELGLVNSMQAKVFAAVHEQHVDLNSPEAIAAWVGKTGIDAKKFMAAFNSFSTSASLGRAKQVIASYAIESIPTLAIQGRFLTSPSMAGGAPQTLAVMNSLIQGLRKG